MRARAATALAVCGTVVAAGLLAFRRPRGRVPEPRKPVDLARYLGRWYELGRYENRFERGCERATADYAQLPDGRISVVNGCVDGGQDGRTRRIQGAAKVVPGSANAKLRVSFFGPFYVGKYWILDHADDYAWSVVGEPSGRFLWLLGRDPDPGEERYAQLAELAAGLGYDPARIRRTRQAA